MRCDMAHMIPACSFNPEAEGRIVSALHITSIIITTTITTTTIITPLGL